MIRTVQRRNLLRGAAIAAGLFGLVIGVGLVQRAATAEETMVEAPIFEVDPLWPKPLPNEALLGETIGVSVDAEDNVWIVHRGAQTLDKRERGAELSPPTSICCRTAPQVIALRVAGGDARRARGLQGQCLVRRQRREGRAHP
jgi:hypothetical protein